MLEQTPMPPINHNGRQGFAINLGSIVAAQADVEGILDEAGSRVGLMSAIELEPIGPMLMGPNSLYEHLSNPSGS